MLGTGYPSGVVLSHAPVQHGSIVSYTNGRISRTTKPRTQGSKVNVVLLFLVVVVVKLYEAGFTFLVLGQHEDRLLEGCGHVVVVVA